MPTALSLALLASLVSVSSTELPRSIQIERWGRKVIVEQVNQRFNGTLLIKGITDNKETTKVQLSLLALKELLLGKLTETREPTVVFSLLKGDRDEQLLFVHVAGLRQSLEKGECSFEKLANDFSTQIAVGFLEPQDSLDAERILSGTRQLYSEYFLKSQCQSTWPFFLLSDGNSADAFEKPHFASSLIASAIVNSIVSTCNLSFGYEVRDLRVARCLLNAKPQIPELTTKDYATPIYFAKVSLDRVQGSQEEKKGAYKRIIGKMIEVGIYLDDIGIKPNDSPPLGSYNVSIDGSDIGTVPDKDLNPLLYAVVSKAGTCRRILTRSGFQTFCIERTENPRKHLDRKPDEDLIAE